MGGSKNLGIYITALIQTRGYWAQGKPCRQSPCARLGEEAPAKPQVVGLHLQERAAAAAQHRTR